MAKHTFERGQRVTYNNGASSVAARVQRLHRDGSVTVEAMFFLDRDGREVPGYLGYRFRMDPADLEPTVPFAEAA